MPPPYTQTKLHALAPTFVTRITKLTSKTDVEQWLRKCIEPDSVRSIYLLRSISCVCVIAPLRTLTRCSMLIG
jgi:hypothetical protein